MIDPGVFVSGFIKPTGTPGQVVTEILADRVRPVICQQLVEELVEVLARAKFRRYASLAEAAAYVETIVDHAEPHDDPVEVPAITPDPDDDYLVALAVDTCAQGLVSGDSDLHEVPLPVPVYTPRQLLDQLPDA